MEFIHRKNGPYIIHALTEDNTAGLEPLQLVDMFDEEGNIVTIERVAFFRKKFKTYREARHFLERYGKIKRKINLFY